MESVYEKEGDSLKITTPAVEVVSMGELLAERDSILASLDVETEQHVFRMDLLGTRLSRVSERIEVATSVGIEIPE